MNGNRRLSPTPRKLLWTSEYCERGHRKMATTGEAAMMRAPPAPLQFTAVSQDIVTAWTATATGLPVNHIADHWKTRRARPAIWLCVPLFLLTSACDSEIVEEARSEEHTSELQSLMRISYAVFCLTKHRLIQPLA